LKQDYAAALDSGGDTISLTSRDRSDSAKDRRGCVISVRNDRGPNWPRTEVDVDRPFPICFFRETFVKTHRLATIHTLKTTDGRNTSISATVELNIQKFCASC